jgi:Phosphoesterase family
VGTEDHGLPAFPGRRPHRDHLRRGQRLGRLLRRDVQPRPRAPERAAARKERPGGGRVGAVLLSPLIRPGTVSTIGYNHYSLLRTIEDVFGLPHLGDAAMPQARSFAMDVFG